MLLREKDNNDNSVCVRETCTFAEAEKVRTICKNVFSDRKIKLDFGKIATNSIDTDFDYAIIVKRADGKKLSKTLVEDVILSVDSVIRTMKSF